MAIAEIILTFLAGFGLLQVGIRMIGRNLSAMTGNRLRTGISRASRTAPLGALFGTLAGFITQSTRTICFVSASFVQAGMLEVRNALAPVDADGNPPKPLITFNVHAEGGRAVVPWNPGKLPPSIRALRIDARPKKGAGDAAEINVLVVPPFLFGDANIDVDETEPEIVEPQPEAAVDAGFFALTPDGPAIPEVPATGAWIIVELANVQQAKVRIFTRDGEHGAREALQTLDLKLKDGRARVQWKPAEPIQRSGMRIGFDVVLAGQIVPGEEAPWVPAFLFGDAAA